MKPYCLCGNAGFGKFHTDDDHAQLHKNHGQVKDCACHGSTEEAYCLMSGCEDCRSRTPTQFLELLEAA